MCMNPMFRDKDFTQQRPPQEVRIPWGWVIAALGVGFTALVILARFFSK